MKCEIERMEIIYTFYFLPFFEKVIKKLLTFCYWENLLLSVERSADGSRFYFLSGKSKNQGSGLLGTVGGGFRYKF